MKLKEIAAFAIKLSAIMLMISVLMHAPRLILSISAIERMYEDQFQPVFYISVVGMFFAIGLISSIVLYKVANSVLKSVPEKSDSVSISETFLLQVFGVYLIISAIQIIM